MNSSDWKPKLVVLAILDGWGIAAADPGNAITQANTVNFSKFWLSYPHTNLAASGQAVGLPRGEDGNTETGHINLGAGRIVYQELERINMAIADGSFFKTPALLEAIKHAKENNSAVHIMGLIGAGGVHSNVDHLLALINLCSLEKFDRVYLHLFTDGRDSPPTSAKTYVKRIEEVISREKIGKIASIMGRYWAMDRDQRWERTEKAYNALTSGEGNLVKTAYDAIDSSYSEGKTDEFIEPSLVADEAGKPLALIKENDSVIFFNFRIDRPRQLTKVFVYSDFKKANIALDKKSVDEEKSGKKEEPFKRRVYFKNLYFVTMTAYGALIIEEGAKPAFPPEVLDNPISAIISASNMRQLKITESEKERFVTFYFNGLREHPFPGEERVIIPSLKVPTYDQKPEMSSAEITKTILSRLGTGEYQFCVVNYPNADMVGHTGNIGATVKAVEILDENIGKLANFVLSADGVLIITADHGNAEEMINASTKEIDTEHSTNPVPFIAISHRFVGNSRMLQTGILADVAPTILNLLGIKPPTSMTGKDLLSDLGF
jgi:2,3-bisphosphoglycerate-independent phosphoglycerate mutase